METDVAQQPSLLCLSAGLSLPVKMNLLVVRRENGPRFSRAQPLFKRAGHVLLSEQSVAAPLPGGGSMTRPASQKRLCLSVLSFNLYTFI